MHEVKEKARTETSQNTGISNLCVELF